MVIGTGLARTQQPSTHWGQCKGTADSGELDRQGPSRPAPTGADAGAPFGAAPAAALTPCPTCSAIGSAGAELFAEQAAGGTGAPLLARPFLQVAVAGTELSCGVVFVVPLRHHLHARVGLEPKHQRSAAKTPGNAGFVPQGLAATSWGL